MAAYVGCPTCGHPIAIHGRGAGACRINGCSCPEYGPFHAAYAEPQAVVVTAPDVMRILKRDVLLGIVATLIVGFAAGLAVGFTL